MRHPTRAPLIAVAAGLAAVAGCGDGKAPTSPSPAVSFLAGTWRGTVTIQPTGQPATSAATTWTFPVVPQTNQQGYNGTTWSAHSWATDYDAGGGCDRAISQSAHPRSARRADTHCLADVAGLGSLGTAEAILAAYAEYEQAA